MTEFLSAKQLAARLQCSERTIRAWTKAGLPAIKINVGRLVRYNPEDVERWLHAQQPEQPKQGQED